MRKKNVTKLVKNLKSWIFDFFFKLFFFFFLEFFNYIIHLNRYKCDFSFIKLFLGVRF